MTRPIMTWLTLCSVVACCAAEAVPDQPMMAAAVPAAHRTVNAAAQPAAPAAAPVVATTPSVRDLSAYFTSPTLRKAVEQFRDGRNNAAAKAFEAVTTKDSDEETARAARFMALLARHDGGVFDPTAARLEAMAESWPLLADYAWFYAGSCHLEAGRADAARKAFARVLDNSTLAPRAAGRLAQSWVALGRPDRAIATLESAVAARPRARATSWLQLAKLKDAAGDRVGADVARRELVALAPRSPEGRRALRALGKTPGLTAEQRHRVAMASFRAQAHTEALKGLDLLLKEAAPGTHLHCDARVKTARVYEKKKKAKVAWRHFAQALGCKGEPLADATFAGGRNRLRAGEHERSIRLLRRHITAFPDRSTVDDAMVMIAKAQRAMGDDASADDTLLEALRRVPDGDLIDEAAWSLLWPRVDAKRWKAAVKMADRILSLVPREKSYRAEGRTGYWRARALQRLRRHDDAIAGYHTVLRQYPLSWYALLAHERLQGYGDEEARAALTAAMEGSAPPASPLQGIPDALWSNPHFRRGVELVRMGLTTSARRELQAVTLDKDAVDPRALTWIKVALYEAAGAHDLATHLARRQEPSFGAHWPVGEHRRLWELAHQRGFSALVQRWSTARGIDPAWVYSIIREESGFNAKIESWANAIGLMQIIMPTAQGLARGTSFKPTAANLRRPEVSIELGTKYLKDLKARHVALPLASAGYNAGSGAVSKWRRAWGRQELDEFVERIPYREARGYAKRVTRSVARYRWLHGDGAILDLPLDPPGRP